MAFGRDQAVGVAIKGKDELSPVVRGIRSTMEGFKRDAQQGFGLAAGISVFRLGTRAIGDVVDGIGNAVNAASELSESQSKVDQVFTDSAGTIHAWASTSAESFGLSKQSALEAAGTFGNFIQALGNSEEEANTMSRSLVELSADLASFNNQDIDEVLVALRSGLAGEAEPMRRLGVSISATRVESYLLAEGIVKSKKEITDAQKVAARYAIIMEDTTKAQGDFARTSDGLANSQRQLAAKIENALADIGTALLPVAEGFVHLASDVIPAAVEGVKDIGEAVSGLLDDLDAAASGTVRHSAAVDLLANKSGESADDILAMANAILENKKRSEELAAIQYALTLDVQATDEAYEQLMGQQLDLVRELEGQKDATEEVSAETLLLMEAIERLQHADEAVARASGLAIRNFRFQGDVTTEAASATDAQSLSMRKLGDFIADTTDLIRFSANATLAQTKEWERQQLRVERLGQALEDVADTSFQDVKQAARETQDAIKKAFEDPIPTIQKLRNEEDRLAKQRRRAMRDGRFDIVALIDARAQEVQQQIRQRQMVNRHYQAEKEEQQARRADMKLLREQFGYSKEKAEDLRQKLIGTFGKDWRTKVDTSQLKYAIDQVDKLRAKLQTLNEEAPLYYTGNRNVGQPTYDPKTHKGDRHSGGIVHAGESAVIRQNEAILMPGSTTNVVPLDQGKTGGSGGNVYIDGVLIGRVIDDYMGRKYGTASRVTNYRRTA